MIWMEIPRLKVMRFAKVRLPVSEKHFYIPPAGPTGLLHTHSSTCRGHPWHLCHPRAESAAGQEPSAISIIEFKKAGLPGHIIMFPENKNLRLKQDGSIVQSGLS